MRQVHYIRIGGGKPPNPLVQLLGAVAGLAVFVVAVLVGGIVLAALVGLILIALLVIYVRFWWYQRRLDSAARDGAGPAGQGDTLDADYRVVDISDPDESRRD